MEEVSNPAAPTISFLQDSGRDASPCGQRPPEVGHGQGPRPPVPESLRYRLKTNWYEAAQPQCHGHECDFFVRNICAPRVDVANK